MFLNDIGQVVSRNKLRSNVTVLGAHLTSPMLLLDSATLEDMVIPDGWKGTLYTTADILEDIRKRMRTQLQRKSQTVTMKNNETTSIELTEANVMEVTVVPISSKDICKVMVLVKDKYVNNLVTNLLSDCVHDYSSNSNLWKAIKEGIDVLYINDRDIKKKESLKGKKSSNEAPGVYPTRMQICTLYEFVRPKYIHGLYETDLPDFLSDFDS